MCLYKVPQGYAYVVGRLGKYHCIKTTGLNVMLPFLDSIDGKVCLKEQMLELQNIELPINNGYSVTANVTIYHRAVDPQLYVYGSEDPVADTSMLIKMKLPRVSSTKDYNSMKIGFDAMEDKNFRKTIDEATDAWGIKVSRVLCKTL